MENRGTFIVLLVLLLAVATVLVVVFVIKPNQDNKGGDKKDPNANAGWDDQNIGGIGGASGGGYSSGGSSSGGWFGSNNAPPSSDFYIPPTLDSNKLLFLGVQGAEVQELQRLINAYRVNLWTPELEENGIFDLETEKQLLEVTDHERSKVTLREFQDFRKCMSELVCRYFLGGYKWD